MPKEEPVWITIAETCDIGDCSMEVRREFRETPQRGYIFRWTASHKGGATLTGDTLDAEDSRTKAEQAARSLNQIYN